MSLLNSKKQSGDINILTGADVCLYCWNPKLYDYIGHYYCFRGRHDTVRPLNLKKMCDLPCSCNPWTSLQKQKCSLEKLASGTEKSGFLFLFSQPPSYLGISLVRDQNQELMEKWAETTNSLSLGPFAALPPPCHSPSKTTLPSHLAVPIATSIIQLWHLEGKITCTKQIEVLYQTLNGANQKRSYRPSNLKPSFHPGGHHGSDISVNLLRPLSSQQNQERIPAP